MGTPWWEVTERGGAFRKSGLAWGTGRPATETFTPHPTQAGWLTLQEACLLLSPLYYHLFISCSSFNRLIF